MISVGVVGGSGYVGLELIRLLLQHPQLELCCVTSREHKAKKLSALHPSLDGLSQLCFSELHELPANLDLVFVAVPHGESMSLVRDLYQRSSGKTRIIDLGSDFRLSAEQFGETYGIAHTAEELLESAVYGVPELFAEQIAKAAIVANPGCFANTITLALSPLAAAGILPSKVQVSAVTGSSGSGATPTKKTHHPERAESISAYSILSHRHVPEIKKALTQAAPNQLELDLQLVPSSGPFRRGIFATCFLELQSSKLDLSSLYAEFIQPRPFMRLRAESPRVMDVVGSNFCDIAIVQQQNTVVVLSTLDNLVKGASGNAVQCMNIMFGLPETSGLKHAPVFP